MNDKVILVGGATGRQGGAVVRHLRRTAFSIRALTRNAGSSAAQALSADGIEVVEGDMNDPSSLTEAMTGAHGVFSVQDFWAVGAEAEIRQGKNMADAARSAGVEHLVYTSVESADRRTGIDHYDSKFVVEEYIRELGLPTTILRPVGFMENYRIPHLEDRIHKGKLAEAFGPQVKIQLIPTDAIGAFAAAVFEEPERFVGQAIEIATDERTPAEVAEAFSQVMGRPVKYSKVPMLIVRLFMGKELYRMFRWYNANGFTADLTALRDSFPNVEFTSLEAWLRDDGWGR